MSSKRHTVLWQTFFPSPVSVKKLCLMLICHKVLLSTVFMRMWIFCTVDPYLNQFYKHRLVVLVVMDSWLAVQILMALLKPLYHFHRDQTKSVTPEHAADLNWHINYHGTGKIC